MDLRLLSPGKNALRMQLLRNSYQAGWIWGNVISLRTPPGDGQPKSAVATTGNQLQVRCCGVASGILQMQLRSKCTTCSYGKLKLPCINPSGCNGKCMNLTSNSFLISILISITPRLNKIEQIPKSIISSFNLTSPCSIDHVFCHTILISDRSSHHLCLCYRPILLTSNSNCTTS